MNARVVIVATLAVVAVVSVVRFSLPEGTVHVLHEVAWILGVVDVLLVAISLLADSGGH